MQPDQENVCPFLGNRITPSYVAFTEDERLIGEAEYENSSKSKLLAASAASLDYDVTYRTPEPVDC